MFLNPFEYHGYLVLVSAFQTPEGKWKGTFTAKKENEEPIEEATIAAFDTRYEAEQYAYMLARKVLW